MWPLSSPVISHYQCAHIGKHLSGLPQQQVGMEQMQWPAWDLTFICPVFTRGETSSKNAASLWIHHSMTWSHLLLCRISWPLLAFFWYSSEHQYVTNTCFFACVNWKSHCECQQNIEWYSCRQDAMCWHLFCQIPGRNNKAAGKKHLVRAIRWLTWSKLASYQYGVFGAQKSHNANSTGPVFKRCKI